MSNSGAFAVAEGGATVTESGGDAVVPWWSFTKTTIAAAALTLVRDGKLDLDPLIATNPFTLRQLLQHRAGVAVYGALPEYHRAVADRAEPWSLSELVSRVDGNRLRFAPGSDFLYSNARRVGRDDAGCRAYCRARTVGPVRHGLRSRKREQAIVIGRQRAPWTTRA